MDARGTGPEDYSMRHPGVSLASENQEGVPDQNGRPSIAPTLLGDLRGIPQSMPPMLCRQTLGTMDRCWGKLVLLEQQKVSR